MVKGKSHFGLIETAFTELIALILFNIEDMQFDDPDDQYDDWCTQTSAGCCLEYVAMISKDAVLDKVTDFISNKISNANSW